MPIKPVISYQGTLHPFALDATAAIVRHQIDKTTVENWADKTAFTNFVDTLFVPTTSDTYVFIRCGCDATYSYADKTAVPDTDFTCSCGRPIFKWGI